MFWEAIAANQVRTVILVLLIFALVTAVAWAIGYLIYGGSSPGIVLFALIFALITTIGTWYNSDRMVIGMSGAHPITREEQPYLWDIVEGLSLAAQLPMPKPYLLESEAMNAFATGRDPQHAAVVVTTGILRVLNREEIEGVLAHELSHVGNHDTLVMAIATVLAAAIGMVGGMTRYGLWFGGGRRRDDRGSNPILAIMAILLLLLAPILATLLRLAVSRQREYLADATGAKLTRNPHALASALAKISGNPNVLEHASPALASMMIVNPLAGLNVQDLLSTHPPIEDRIRRLESM